MSNRTQSNKESSSRPAPSPAPSPEYQTLDLEPLDHESYEEEEVAKVAEVAEVAAAKVKPDVKFPDTSKAVLKSAPIKGGVKVVALRPCYIAGLRYAEGDVFFVESLSKVGDSMECVDPVQEKQRKKKKLEYSKG